MSKLYNKYLSLKKENIDKVYLFKSGIFYVALEKDAELLAAEFDFKIIQLNEHVVKCGFPQTSLQYYTQLLNNRKISFEIIDPDYSKIENYSDYLNNNKVKEIMNTLHDIDINNITFKQAFDLLCKLNEDVKKIYE